VERQVKERLVGAAVIVAVAVILIPELLSGPSSNGKPVVASTRTDSSTDQHIKTYEFRLDRPGQSTGALKSSTRTPPPEPSMPLEKPAETPRIRSEETVALQQSKLEPVKAKPPSTPTPTPPTPAPSTKPASSPAAAAQTPAPQPQSAREAANTSGWAVQLGSFADQARATKLAARMRAAGHNAYIVPLRRPDGKVWQRVRIGPYSERSAAEAALTRVAGEVRGAAIVAQP
jgi:DedD protein